MRFLIGAFIALLAVNVASAQSVEGVYSLGTPNTGIGIAPVVSAASENSHILKASSGNLYSVYATNQTATAGFLAILNSKTVPADGAITPIACIPLPASANASMNWAPGPPLTANTGIVAVLTSASTCFTKTTGVITGFISGSVQ